ncbi:MAG: hypothetical protein RI907_1299 [Pseudomonadota bacterium]|jgi:hypothetical protein
MSLLLCCHLLGLGIWAGCIATEVVLELTEGDRPPPESRLAALHARIDQMVELPAIMVTAFTGLALLHSAPWAHDPLLQAKIAFGALAVGLNLVAAYTVHRRHQAWLQQDWRTYGRFHLLHERVGTGCVLSILGAIGLGGWHLAT